MDALLGAVDPETGRAPSGLAVYCCGPVPMLESLRRHLADRPDIELHYERFTPPPVENGREFIATIASTGAEITVGATESLLSAVQREIPSVPYSCRQASAEPANSGPSPGRSTIATTSSPSPSATQVRS